MSTYFRVLIYIGIITIISSCSTSKFASNYIKTELYFGLSKKDGVVTIAEWNAFKVDVISKKFSGFTQIDSKGFWTNSKGESVSENSKLIVYLNKGTKQDSIAIAFVINTYKSKFNQESVLKIDTPVNANF